MTRAIKTSGEFKKKDFNSLVEKNEDVKHLLEKKNKDEEKRLKNKRALKLRLDGLLASAIKQKDSIFLK